MKVVGWMMFPDTVSKMVRWSPAGKVVAVLVVVVIVLGWGSQRGYTQAPEARTRTTTASAPASGSGEQPMDDEAGGRRGVRRWSETLLWLSVLLLVLFVSAVAIIVFSRRFRAYLSVGRGRRTPCTDVWSMHRLPGESAAGRGGEADREDGGEDDDRPMFGPDKSPPDEPSIG